MVREEIVPSDSRPARSRGGRAPRGRAAVWLRRLAIAAVVVAALPFALTLLYAVPGVRPVSVPMAVDLVTLQGYDRRWTPLGEISPNVTRAVTMSEDGQFCFHSGIDWGEMSGVIDDALSGVSPRGASTITMQTVKNLYLWLGRSYIRKALELPLAVYFDLVLSKRRIMEIYLNIAEWGPGIYGIEAAARHYFGRRARDLTPRQAALLTVALPNPIDRNPAKAGPGLKRVASIVQRRASRAGGYVGCVD